MNINKLIDRVRQIPREIPGRMRVSVTPKEIDDEMTSRLGTVGGIELNADRCAELNAALQNYVLTFHVGVVQGRDKNLDQKLKDILEYTDGLVECLKAIDFTTVELNGPDDIEGKVSLYVGAIVRDERIKPYRLIQQLSALRDGIEAAVSHNGGRPESNPYLAGFLEQLSEIYLASGGTSTGVSRKGQKRTSKFIDFAFELMELLPAEMRYASGSALASFWERKLKQKRARAKKR
jgi:hypothetical protein